MIRVFCLWLFLVFLAGKAPAQDNSSQEDSTTVTASPIRSLTAKQYNDYLNGNGMGLAGAAELNNYPGPMHVLQYARELKLTASQKTQLEAVRKEVKRKAVEMGGFILKEEQKLNDLFASAKVDEGSIIYFTNKIGAYQGELRNAHLQAHLKTRRILTPDQLKRYAKLKGKK